MAVPNRPVSGQPIETSWGDVVHDTAVAQDVQAGQTTIALSSQSSQSSPTITFARPFASAPLVTCALVGSPGGSNKITVRVQTISATSMTLSAWTADGAQITLTVVVDWIAVGPRA